MSIQKNIGKNTIGDNQKMGVSLHEYHMSTQNLSEVFRSSLGVGMIVPCYKLLCQKGDVVDLQMINKTLTHPTLGPLFGSYKLQHFFFFGPIRLYNSWLHNNRNGIGMKMKDIQLPKMGLTPVLATGQTYVAKTNRSSLYSYLGWKGSILKNTSVHNIYKNGVPLLMVWDTFKNYFANTQEDKFYMIKSTNFVEYLKVKSNETGSEGIYNYFNERKQSIEIGDTSTITITNDNITNYEDFWNNVKINMKVGAVTSTVPIANASSDLTKKTIILDKLSSSNVTILNYLTWIQNSQAINLGEYRLGMLDDIRDEILAKKGNEPYYMQNNSTVHTTEIATFYGDVIAAQSSKLGGMLLKTYDSDIFQNWVKTEWIDGPNGINEISAINVSGGKLYMDALNLQQKIYNMLNRVAVSGGSYRNWLETMYTAGKYIDRPETPVFIGGMTQYIEFEEVISKSATETSYGSQPLGDLAGRGYAKKPENSGHIHYQCEEPGYIMGFIAITPMLDYSQGNDFDLNLETIDDLHKPALDGIGYQDSLNEQRAWWTASYTGDNTNSSGIQDTKAGKTVAWIDYMTSFNKTHGNFAAGESEDFMCLNRRYEGEEDAASTGTIKDLTTYIDPTKHIEIFADTALDSQNFWVQSAFQVTRRGNYSAKQIPNL